jgi:ABC-type multidrug transport system ATPase subunit
MDVIAGRKTAGKVEGSIRVNGHPQSFPSFNRLMGYVEQTDIHVGMHTVREAIEFSAKLRLPSGVTDEARGHFVEHLLDELELRPLADRIIGDANVEGLSPGELKRLTIAVEMAANPTFLFLDEPSQSSYSNETASAYSSMWWFSKFLGLTCGCVCCPFFVFFQLPASILVRHWW